MTCVWSFSRINRCRMENLRNHLTDVYIFSRNAWPMSFPCTFSFTITKMLAQNNVGSFSEVFKCLPGLQTAWHHYADHRYWFCWWEWSSWWSPSENTSDCAMWPRWYHCHIHSVSPSLCTCHLWRQKYYISKETSACILLTFDGFMKTEGWKGLLW